MDPTEKSNDVPEIEITPVMIEAAVKVIADTYGVCSEYVAAGLAEDVFKAMIRSRAKNPNAIS